MGYEEDEFPSNFCYECGVIHADLIKFREMAARVCEDSVLWWPARGNECTKSPYELAKDIRNLPSCMKGVK